MKLSDRLPVLPAHCYAPSPDHELEDRRTAASTSRQPLQESTGNIQHPHMAWYAQQLEVLSSIPASMPPLMAPILRTQSPLGPDYGAPAYTLSQSQRRRHELQVHGSRRESQGCNPLLALMSQSFKTYRKNQADKPDQKWPQEFEGWFIDALLLIPRMGKDKYHMKGQLLGRNQLIGQYLLLACCQYAEGEGGESARQLMQDKETGKLRKKVSSHMQVLKPFFKAHRCFHFLFGEQPKGTNKKTDKVGLGKASLKTNPILTALSQDRLPSERPNYEYFAQILALNDQVQFRPKRCWIFVSHKDVVVGEEGVGYLAATGTRLSQTEYPHLPRNLERETWPKEEQQLFKGSLLHEFTKEFAQEGSGSVRELTKDWESLFPDLHQRVKTITSTNTDTRCEFLHLHTTLELNARGSFPAGSSLSSWVEINIEQPRLLNHRWKVETRLVRPAELSYSHEDELGAASGQVIHERQKEFTLKYQHRPGCDGSIDAGRGQCDCLAQRSRREGVSVPFPVPFPATAWAQTLTNCADYPAHPFSGSKQSDRESGPAGRTGNDSDEKSRPRRRAKQPTQMDLVQKIVMMQEIFSCPPTSPHDDGSDSAKWTLRSVILWTFETVHSIDKHGKLVTASGGKTDWRFLTILDPDSEYHQRQAIVSGRRASADDYRGTSSSLSYASRPSSRATVVSPSPSYQQHLSGSMSESFATPWDSAGGLGSLTGSAAQAAYGAHFMPQTMPSHAASNETGYGLLDSFSSHSGLATPPPTASLASSFAQNFDAASTSSDMLPGYMAAHAAVTTGGMDASSHTLGGALAAVTDPFLAHVGAIYGGGPQDSIHGWDNHSMSGTVDSWGSGYSNPNPSAAQPHNGATTTMGWQPHQQSLPLRRQSDQQHHHHHPAQYQTQQHHRQNRHPWVPAITTTTASSTAGSIDEHDPWTPITSANTSNGDAMGCSGLSSHDHHQHHNISGSLPSTTAAGCEANRDWVHINGPSASFSSASSSGSSRSEDHDYMQEGEVEHEQGNGLSHDHDHDHDHDYKQEDLSQDWEEIVPLANNNHLSAGTTATGTTATAMTAAAADCHRHHQIDASSGLGVQLAGSGTRSGSGLKRTREESFEGDEDGAEGGYRRARVRS